MSVDLTGREMFIDQLSGRVRERAVLKGQSKQKNEKKVLRMSSNKMHCNQRD